MPAARNYLAVDLGAESGRAIVGALDDGRLSLAETHRFDNGPVYLPDGMHWDVLRLWSEIQAGIAASTAKFDGRIDAIGLDTWGVDFALLDRGGALLSNPHHYRDSRTDGLLERAFEKATREQIFERTGIQFMQINSLYQLLALALDRSPLLDVAQTLVMIPDLFNYWLSGEIACELTDATTTQCFDPRAGDWAFPVIEAMGIPRHLFRPVTAPGAVLGRLRPDVAEAAGTLGLTVVVPACHDTGSAVVAVPAEAADFAWISSGTWSIMGTEAGQPVITPDTLRHNFTNEGGVFGSWRLSKNVMGLWLVQECRRAWAHQGEDLSYDDLTHQAAQARPFVAVLDPDHPDFLHPGDMPARIRGYCKSTGQPVPESKGEVVRVALESIALKYRWVLAKLEEVTGRRLEPLHIVGGGTKNRLLNQLAADATGRTCVVGPVEATAIGNILMQAIALGHLGSLADARAVVRRSFAPEVVQPASREGWDDAYDRLNKVMNT